MKTEKKDSSNIQYGVVLEKEASTLTQGHRWGRYHEGNNGTYYTL